MKVKNDKDTVNFKEEAATSVHHKYDSSEIKVSDASGVSASDKYSLSESMMNNVKSDNEYRTSFLESKTTPNTEQGKNDYSGYKSASENFGGDRFNKPREDVQNSNPLYKDGHSTEVHHQYDNTTAKALTESGTAAGAISRHATESAINNTAKATDAAENPDIIGGDAYRASNGIAGFAAQAAKSSGMIMASPLTQTMAYQGYRHVKDAADLYQLGTAYNMYKKVEGKARFYSDGLFSPKVKFADEHGTLNTFGQFLKDNNAKFITKDNRSGAGFRNDLNNNKTVLTNYLNSRNIYNIDALSRLQIENAIRKGVLGNIQLSEGDKEALKQLSKIRNVEKKYGSDLKLTTIGLAVARQTMKDADAYQGFETTMVGVKVGQSVVKLGKTGLNAGINAPLKAGEAGLKAIKNGTELVAKGAEKLAGDSLTKAKWRHMADSTKGAYDKYTAITGKVSDKVKTVVKHPIKETGKAAGKFTVKGIEKLASKNPVVAKGYNTIRTVANKISIVKKVYGGVKKKIANTVLSKILTKVVAAVTAAVSTALLALTGIFLVGFLIVGIASLFAGAKPASSNSPDLSDATVDSSYMQKSIDYSYAWQQGYQTNIRSCVSDSAEATYGLPLKAADYPEWHGINTKSDGWYLYDENAPEGDKFINTIMRTGISAVTVGEERKPGMEGTWLEDDIIGYDLEKYWGPKIFDYKSNPIVLANPVKGVDEEGNETGEIVQKGKKGNPVTLIGTTALKGDASNDESIIYGGHWEKVSEDDTWEYYDLIFDGEHGPYVEEYAEAYDNRPKNKDDQSQWNVHDEKYVTYAGCPFSELVDKKATGYSGGFNMKDYDPNGNGAGFQSTEFQVTRSGIPYEIVAEPERTEDKDHAAAYGSYNKDIDVEYSAYPDWYAYGNDTLYKAILSMYTAATGNGDECLEFEKNYFKHFVDKVCSRASVTLKTYEAKGGDKTSLKRPKNYTADGPEMERTMHFEVPGIGGGSVTAWVPYTYQAYGFLTVHFYDCGIQDLIRIDDLDDAWYHDPAHHAKVTEHVAEWEEDDEWREYAEEEREVDYEELPPEELFPDLDFSELSDSAIYQALIDAGYTPDKAAAMSAAYSALVNSGYSSTFAIGFMANIAHEGTLGGVQGGGTLTTLAQLQAFNAAHRNDSGHAFGMCQWDSGRKGALLDAYIAAAQANGGSLTPAQMAQIECSYLISELRSSESKAAQKIAAAKTPAEAAEACQKWFERPGKKTDRGSEAKKIAAALSAKK